MLAGVEDAEITVKVTIRRGTYTSVAALQAAIGTYIDAWNERCEPFHWVKDGPERRERQSPCHAGFAAYALRKKSASCSRLAAALSISTVTCG